MSENNDILLENFSRSISYDLNYISISSYIIPPTVDTKLHILYRQSSLTLPSIDPCFGSKK